MGEALISRAGGGEGDAIVPVTPGYHTILVTLRDPDGGLMGNWPITCKDGSQTYKYTTNAKGQTMFVCNSGAANIFVNNYNGSYRVIDISNQWANIDAPVGLTTKLNMNLNYGTTPVDFLSNSLFEFRSNRNCNVYIVGAGGGGGYPIVYEIGVGYYFIGGGGGGAGYMNSYDNQILFGKYNFISGKGGNAGINNWQYVNGNTGGTSYIVNSSYSAIGGKGGLGESDRIGNYNCTNGGKGGLGNGAAGVVHDDEAQFKSRYAGNSSVDFAGGGGGSGVYNGSNTNRYNGGYPYGGDGAYSMRTSGSEYIAAKAGTRGGGGGGGVTYQSGSIYTKSPSKGGNGMLRIEIKY